MTTLTKFAQSCFLFEKAGHRLLLDPGKFDFDQHGRRPEDWPSLEGIIITHEHFDHADLEVIKFLTERDRCSVYTTSTFAQQLVAVGVTATGMQPNETVDIGAFTIRSISQQHGALSGGRPIPENIGFIVDETFYTPGDSIPVPEMPKAPVLLVPVAGPEMNFVTAKMMIEASQPQLAVAMHYSNTANFPLNMDELKALRFPGTEFLVLEYEQSFTWPK